VKDLEAGDWVIPPSRIVTILADGEDLVKGNVVYVTGFSGGAFKVKKTDGAKTGHVLGVALQDIKNGEKGDCGVGGAIYVIASEAIAVGDPIVSALGGKVGKAAALSITQAYVKGTATTYVPDDSTIGGTSLAASGTLGADESGSLMPGGEVIGEALEAASADGDTILVRMKPQI